MLSESTDHYNHITCNAIYEKFQETDEICKLQCLKLIETGRQ